MGETRLAFDAKALMNLNASKWTPSPCRHGVSVISCLNLKQNSARFGKIKGKKIFMKSQMCFEKYI
jgi:hypothetical protein